MKTVSGWFGLTILICASASTCGATPVSFNLAFNAPLPELPNLEPPNSFGSAVGEGTIFSVSVVFDDVHVQNSSLESYIGVNDHIFLRAGIDETDVYSIFENTTKGDMYTFTAPGALSNGDDIEVTISRQSGLWRVSWNNLTAGTSGSLPAVALPWLDAQPGLSFGVHDANSQLPASSVGISDSFSVTVVPEPSSMALFGLGASWLIVGARRARRRQ